MLWLLAGAALGFAVQLVWVMLRYRLDLARLNPAHLERVALIRSVLSGRNR
jgi:hypothetical protein